MQPVFCKYLSDYIKTVANNGRYYVQNTHFTDDNVLMRYDIE